MIAIAKPQGSGDGGLDKGYNIEGWEKWAYSYVDSEGKAKC